MWRLSSGRPAARASRRISRSRAAAAADLASEAPLPPPRPADVKLPEAAPERPATPVEAADEPAGQGGAASPQETRSEITYAYGMVRVSLPKVIDGAQPILPTRFVAYAELVR
jgi:hypothetical protein